MEKTLPSALPIALGILLIPASAAGQMCLGAPNEDLRLSVLGVAVLDEVGLREFGAELRVRVEGRATVRGRGARRSLPNGVRRKLFLDVAYQLGPSGRTARVCPTAGIEATRTEYEEGGPETTSSWTIPVGVGLSPWRHESGIARLSAFVVPRVYFRERFFTGESTGIEDVVGASRDPGATDVGVEIGLGARRWNVFGVVGLSSTWDAPSPRLSLEIGGGW